MEFYKNYKVIKKIGEGAYSEVLKVQHIETKNFYAAKILRDIYENEEQVEKCREISALMKLENHPNINRFIDVICNPLPGKIVIIFNLMDMNMYDYIKSRSRCLSEFKVKNFLFQLSNGLLYLHNNGLFHRDLKPENILIKLSGKSILDKKIIEVVQIADLGSVCNIFHSQPHTPYISTRWYRSPECILTNGYYGPKMDIWSLGCVYYEMLTSKPLFPGESRIDQLYKIHCVLGTPTSNILSKLKNKNIKLSFPKVHATGFRTLVPLISDTGLDILTKMLIYLPENRIDIKKLMMHPYFYDYRYIKRILYRWLSQLTFWIIFQLIAFNNNV